MTLQDMIWINIRLVNDRGMVNGKHILTHTANMRSWVLLGSAQLLSWTRLLAVEAELDTFAGERRRKTSLSLLIQSVHPGNKHTRGRPVNRD